MSLLSIRKKMKQFSQHISILPVGQTVTDPFDLMSDQSFELEFRADNDDQGTYWQCDKTITIDTPPATALRFFQFVRQCIVTVKDSRGTTYRIGSEEMPVRTFISNQLNTAQLHIYGTLNWNPLQ